MVLLAAGAYAVIGLPAGCAFWVGRRGMLAGRRLLGKVDVAGYLGRNAIPVILLIAGIAAGASSVVVRLFYRKYVDRSMIAWALFIIIGSMVWAAVTAILLMIRLKKAEKGAAGKRIMPSAGFALLIHPLVVPGYILGLAVWINRTWLKHVVNIPVIVILLLWFLGAFSIASKWKPGLRIESIVMGCSALCALIFPVLSPAVPHVSTPLEHHGILPPYLVRTFRVPGVISNKLVSVFYGEDVNGRADVMDQPVLPEDFDFAAWVETECRVDSRSGDLNPVDIPEKRDWNVMLLTVDSLRADHMSCYGYAYQTTPYIDRLAAGGVLFERCYAQGGDSIYALNSVLSGMLPWNYRDRIDPMLAGIMAGHGLATGYAGYDYVLKGGAFREGYEALEILPGERGEIWGRTTSEQIVDRIIALTERFRGRRFFIYSHLLDPHAEYVFNSETSRFEDSPHRDYDGEIAFTDLHLGRLFSYLWRTGLMDRTLILITADHGEAFGEHGNRWHGRYLYDESVRIPLVMSLPGIPGRRVTVPVGPVQIAPTILHFLGIPGRASMDGTSLLPLIYHGDPGDIGPVEMFIPNEKFKKHGIVYGPWKYIRNVATGTEELYHLIRDPGETVNLIGQVRNR
jgi:choline-sulfatase